jgi:hypothetical protein
VRSLASPATASGISFFYVREIDAIRRDHAACIG